MYTPSNAILLGLLDPGGWRERFIRVALMREMKSAYERERL
jgi:hypothetical protein